MGLFTYIHLMIWNKALRYMTAHADSRVSLIMKLAATEDEPPSTGAGTLARGTYPGRANGRFQNRICAFLPCLTPDGGPAAPKLKHEVKHIKTMKAKAPTFLARASSALRYSMTKEAKE